MKSPFSLIAAAQGVQDEGLSFVLPRVPDAAFVALANLERHWITGAKPPKVLKLMRQLNEVASPIWTEDFLKAIRQASRLTAATNFPIGLLSLPGDSDPLALALPIAYEPLSPLTRRLQHAFTPFAHHDWTRGFSALIVECIPKIDPVGEASRVGWDVASEFFEASREGPESTLHRREASSVAELRDVLNEVRPDIAVISAHGFSDPASNVAGINVGDEPFLGFGLEYIPPAILLSACHVSPRGLAQVSIVDMLLQQGAFGRVGDPGARGRPA